MAHRPADRSPLVAFNVEGWSPYDLADGLDARDRSRAGCHCASLAHRWLGLAPGHLQIELRPLQHDGDMSIVPWMRWPVGRVRTAGGANRSRRAALASPQDRVEEGEMTDEHPSLRDEDIRSVTGGSEKDDADGVDGVDGTDADGVDGTDR